jgi:hypothetical protein
MRRSSRDNGPRDHGACTALPWRTVPSLGPQVTACGLDTGGNPAPPLDDADLSEGSLGRRA